MTTKKKLTQEELILAFNEYMPKRPVYPPLINAAETWENSDTDDDENEQEETDPSKIQHVTLEIAIEQSAECAKAYEIGKVPRPEAYLIEANVLNDLEDALNKLMNLRIKPTDPVEWLAFQLMNMSESKKHPAGNQPKYPKPTGFELDFKVLGMCVVNDDQPSPIASPEQPIPSTSEASTSTAGPVCGKRKLTD